MRNNEIIPYIEMCQTEGVSLQRGMNYQLGKSYSVILMSLRRNAPYNDALQENGTVLIYEGHDASRRPGVDVKTIDQPMKTSSGTLTQNGLFFTAAQDYKGGQRAAEKVRVYEKIHSGIWSNNGLFELIDAWISSDSIRNVFKFKLRLADNLGDLSIQTIRELEPSRIIPSSVKLEVWTRDRGKCVQCGKNTELHFDHVIPFSKGGTSLLANNIQLLCARHNLAKKDNIE